MAWFVCVALMCVIVVASIFVASFARRLCSSSLGDLADGELPRTAVLVGLKGADPFLADSLRRLMAQDYPCYELHICVDSREDPAWDVVQGVIANCESSHVHVQVYRHVPEHGQVNCTTSKQVQLARQLDDSFAVFALADGDMLPHRRWLRTLVAPLVRDAVVGATFGNRWFMPAEGRFGSLVRYVWNAGAVVYMWTFGMPWGGCFAIRADVVRRLNLIDKWSKVIAIDALAKGDLRQAGLELRFVPALMMVNREECGLAYCLNFFQRQLTWTRLYHADWPFVVLSNTLMTLLVSVCLLAAATGIISGDPGMLWAGAVGVCVYMGGMLAMALVLESAVRRVVAARGEATRWLSPASVIKLTVVPAIVLLFQFAAMINAATRRHVHWRGDIIEIRGPFDIRTLPRTAAPNPPPAADDKTSL